MLSSYLTTAFRQLLAAKLYAAINVIGLAVGLASRTFICTRASRSSECRAA